LIQLRCTTHRVWCKNIGQNVQVFYQNNSFFFKKKYSYYGEQNIPTQKLCLTSNILETAEKIIPSVKKQMPVWMQPDTVVAINSKKNIHKKFGESSI